jgi:hypothetical protein
MANRRLAIFCGTVVGVMSFTGSVLAITLPGGTVVGHGSPAVTMPTDPPSLPPLQMPHRNAFRAAYTAQTSAANEKKGDDTDQNGVELSYGVVGVWLDGALSTATILDKTGIVSVDLATQTYHGKAVRSITMNEVTLADGTIIHRGIAPANGSGDTIPDITVPDIIESPSLAPVLQPTPTLPARAPAAPVITPEPDITAQPLPAFVSTPQPFPT